MMLGIPNIERMLEKIENAGLLQGAFRLQWIAHCMAFIEDAEKDRIQLAKDGFIVDSIVLDQLEDCTSAMLDMIKLGHRPEFALLYGKEIFIEDHERAMYNATIALRELGRACDDAAMVYNDAYYSALKQGNSEQYSRRYAEAMNNEPWDEKAHSCAKVYEDAFDEARAENRGEAYCRKYAEMVGDMEYDRSDCKLYAKTYERAVTLYTDESERKKFTDYFLKVLFKFQCRNDFSQSDENYSYDKAIAYILGSRFECELKIEGFADKYVDLYLNAFSDYPVGREDPVLIAKNTEIAKERTMEYFNRAKGREELAQRLKPRNK
jgi:hypothetical protein